MEEAKTKLISEVVGDPEEAKEIIRRLKEAKKNNREIAELKEYEKAGLRRKNCREKGKF